ncbi:MAG: TonB-dependent receptor [Hymenobacter sp.]
MTSTSNSGTVDASLNYTHLYDVKQRELSVLTLFSRNNQTNDFTNDVFAPSDRSYVMGQLGNNNQSHNQELTGQLDYQTPTVKDQLLEVGVKNIVRRVTSDYAYFYDPALTRPGPRPTTPSSISRTWPPATWPTRWAYPRVLPLKPGVRFEYTTIDARLQRPQRGTHGHGHSRTTSRCLPSVNLSRKFENGDVLKLAYNIRIQRPSLQFLNPNVQASNPLNASAGNPTLRPENTQNYELGYSTQIKQKVNVNISTFVRSTNNAIQTVRVPLPDSLNPTRAVGRVAFHVPQRGHRAGLRHQPVCGHQQRQDEHQRQRGRVL